MGATSRGCRGGSFILVSLALVHWVSPYWLWFTAFVGFNLFQSSFTRVCPLEWVLDRAGTAGRPAGRAGS